MVNTELRILRVFGPTAAEVSTVLRQARADGCPGLRLLERDGEFAVCVQVSAPNRAMAEQYCEKWVQRLRAKFGDDVFATGETSLAQATLDTLLEKRKLLVAADETTGRLVGALLQPLPHSEAVFDFGTESYADPEKQKQITVPPQLLKKFPGDVVQAAAGRALAAMQAAGADFAAVYMPATVGQCPFVLICDNHGAAACALPPDLNDATIGNQILDLLRRRVLGLRLTDSCIIFRPGRERPLLIVSEAGRERGNTVRFSLRRRTPPTTEPDRTADFEPMLDFDTAEPVAPPTPEPAPAESADPGATRHLNVGRTHTAPPAVSEPTGTIRFESELDEENAAAPAAAANTTDPLDIRTAGPEAARTARSLRVNRRAPAPEVDGEPFAAPEAELPSTSGHTIRRSPAPSILDDDVPDFSAELDPEALAAAQAADEADAAAGRATSAEDFTKAASRLFDDNDSDDTDTAAPPRRRHGDKPGAENSIRSHSLAMIEKSEKRRRRMVITVLVVLTLVIVGGAVALWWFFSNDLGARPAAKSYGTALYDNTAESYLTKGTEKLPGVVGYLGFPGMEGRFVYAADTATAENADNETTAQTRFATASALNSTAPGNTVLASTDALLTPLTTEEGIKANSGFTLYLPGRTYRFKVLAVYYYDPAEQGDGAFDLYGSTDLSSYYDYLRFVAGIQARSLWDTEVEVGDASRFLTLTAPSEDAGVQLCVTGRLIEDGEAEVLNASAITAADDPLLTAVQYQSKNQPMPTVSALLGASIDRYAKQSAATAANRGSSQTANDSADTSTDLSQAASEMQQRTDALIASADKLMAGLTDVAGSANATETDLNKGAEGSLPEQTVTVDQIANANPTPAPADSTADGSDSTENGDTTPDAPDNSGDNNTNNGGTSAEGETINVTMNGTAQTMDLVRCLAMVAQNELGSSAPAEAYKAQCVATHCWILSQSGYPSVLGAEPGAAALAAAQEVAHVLVTYNGQVCFTPYFASASTGTASAAEVWGNDRAWLQAVDSPYDQQIATNWNTNGNSSGTARFSRQTLQDRIKDVMDIDLSGVDPNSWFTIQSANQYGWVAKIQVGPDASVGTVSGRWFRENLLARQSVDGRSLRSQCFTVSYNADLDCFIFDVYGYGHGCGMSQWGAIGYARNGWSYRDILTHYFVGTTLTTY